MRPPWPLAASDMLPPTRKARQRFSLAHEFKHILDDPLIDRLSTHLPAGQRHERAERLCNYFAACLLMPRAWVKRDWCEGRQSTHDLARRYYVSYEAMTTRLSELGLTPRGLTVEQWSAPVLLDT